MTLLGDAAVAMWWNVAEDHLTEFHEWHSKEHLPERLGIPGFNRGSRWQQEDSGEFFVLYELAAYETLISDAYLARLNDPTPWSQAMMPLHSGMTRSQCRVIASHGRGIATYMSTTRLSPKDGQDEALESRLRSVLAGLPEAPGITGAHLLRTETPNAAMTAEQQIRGADAVADWVILLAGHNRQALQATCSGALDRGTLDGYGAQAVTHGAPYRLVHALVPQDV